MSDARSRSEKGGFDRDAFVAKMIPILASRNLEIGERQLVELMNYVELSDLAWAKLTRRRDRKDNDLLCQVIRKHPRFRLEAAGSVLMNDPTPEQLCQVHTFVPQMAALAATMLEKLGCTLPE